MRARYFGRTTAAIWTTGLLLTLALGGCEAKEDAPVECRTSNNCIAGEICSSEGKCIPEDLPSADAGTDASSSDAAEDIADTAGEDADQDTLADADTSQALVASVVITTEDEDEDFTLAKGESVQLVATAFDEDSVALPDRGATWASSKRNIAPVDPTGLVTGESAGVATITAIIEGISHSVDIEVIIPNTPPTAAAARDQTVPRGSTVRLDANASADAEDSFDDLAFAWEITLDPSEGVDIITDADTATPSFIPSHIGDYEITLTVTDTGGLTDTASVTIGVEAPEDCLIISEYVMGAGLNKAVELYNCGSDTLVLSQFYFCTDQNDNDARAQGCNDTSFVLEGTLDSGGVHVVCNGGADAEILAACEQRTNKVLHNGDDRLIVFRDEPPINGSFNHGIDTVMDVLGEIGKREEIFKDMTLERCNFAPFMGIGTFAVGEYYIEHPKGTFSGLGVPPTEGCPL